MGRLDGKVALVTGGARGIGRAICERLEALGARAGVLDLSIPKGVAGEVCDVGDHDQVRAAVASLAGSLGPPAVLVNNAGWDKMQPFLQNEPALWDKLIAVNLRGVLNVCHVVVPLMAASGDGRVVNVASDAGRVGSSGEAVYSACKGGVIAFTKALAREVARDGVTVNCVCPGPTDTPLLAEVTADERGAKIIESIVHGTPTRRLAQPEEIAEAVAFFATGPSHITGQVLSVSGGLTMAG